ncbi:MAG TPA: nucleoside recognition domain-containing protein [Clostridia bacterium]|jgi:spore maturation protein B
MTDYILPLLFLILFTIITFKNIPAYDYFTEGAKGAINLGINIFPYVAAIMIMVNLLRLSGITDYLATVLAPVFKFLGIPTELAELTLLRPFSGSGSLALLNDLMTKYGPDSYVARAACVIMGSSETVFYVAGVYFSSSKVKKLRFAIPVALFSSFLSVVLGCLLARVL